MDQKRILTAYFSRGGQNYSNGKLVELKVGNTKAAAEILAGLAGAELFEILPKREYPLAYRECTELARKELLANSRPELTGTVDVSEYDVLLLGYPNWCGTMPMAVWTFLDGQELSGKTILPFCTNEGSGMGSSERDLKRLCPGADIRPGLAIHGSAVPQARAAMEKWLEKNLG